MECRHKKNLTIGEIVLIQNHQTRPLSWPMGSILDTHSGNDNQKLSYKFHSTSTFYIQLTILHLSPTKTFFFRFQLSFFFYIFLSTNLSYWNTISKMLLCFIYILIFHPSSKKTTVIKLISNIQTTIALRQFCILIGQYPPATILLSLSCYHTRQMRMFKDMFHSYSLLTLNCLKLVCENNDNELPILTLFIFLMYVYELFELC